MTFSNYKMLTSVWRHLVLLASFLISRCLANYEVTLDLMTCLQRSQKSLDSGDILLKWKGAKLEKCNFQLIHQLQNGKICIEPLTFVNKECSVTVQYSTTGIMNQFGDCNTKPSRKCVKTDRLKLIIHANSSSTDSFALRLSSESSEARDTSISYTTKSNLTSKESGLPLWAIIAITCGVFIPAILIVIIVAVICLRKNNQLKGHRYQVPQKELSSITANGSHDIIDPSTPIQRVSSITEEDEDMTPSDAGVRLSANV